MHEILRSVPLGAWVLDLGSGRGSFPAEVCSGRVVRADLEPPQDTRGGYFVLCDACRLPFRDGLFAAVISNHSLEHFSGLEKAIAEIGRVLNSAGALYIAIPDASTFCDWLYRWLARGGGHVNRFLDEKSLVALVEKHTSLAHSGTRRLSTSFSFLNRANLRSRPPRRLLLLGGGNETVLNFLSYVLRLTDKWLGSSLTSYGWAMYFGNTAAVDTRTRTNVCVRCGSGHSAEGLRQAGLLTRFGFLRSYRCPDCGAVNPFLEDGS